MTFISILSYVLKFKLSFFGLFRGPFDVHER